MARMPSQAIVQPSLPGFCQIEDAIGHLSQAGIEERGAIFTRREVVDFILDLVGYRIEVPLHRMRLLEPSFGNGDFLLPAVQRLMEAYRRCAHHRHVDVSKLCPCIRAVELHEISFGETRQALLALLKSYGVSQLDADNLAAYWLIEGDFLLTDFAKPFTHVIGNPPYLRQEMIPDALLNAYRSRFKTLYDRADIYVPFYRKIARSSRPEWGIRFYLLGSLDEESLWWPIAP